MLFLGCGASRQSDVAKQQRKQRDAAYQRILHSSPSSKGHTLFTMKSHPLLRLKTALRFLTKGLCQRKSHDDLGFEVFFGPS